MSEYQQLLSQIAELQEKASLIRENERKIAIEKIKSLMQDFSIGFDELGLNELSSSNKNTPSKKIKKAAAKYCDSSGNEWTGRGLQPRWLKTELMQGKSLESFLI